jgi:hypothetical protein
MLTIKEANNGWIISHVVDEDTTDTYVVSKDQETEDSVAFKKVLEKVTECIGIVDVSGFTCSSDANYGTS